MLRIKVRWLIMLVMTGCFLLQVSGVSADLSPDRGLYGFAFDTSWIYKLHPDTGIPTAVTSMGDENIGNAMAYDTSTDTMYVLYQSELLRRDGTRPVYFGALDIVTGETSVISDTTVASTVMGMAYDSMNDVLYGAEIMSGQLVVMDRSTGAMTPIGPFDSAGPLRIQGLAYCPANDTLYGIDTDSVFTIDRGTGEATAIGVHGMMPGRMGFAYDENHGLLYAVTSETSDLFSINMETGDAFALGSIGARFSCLVNVPTRGMMNVLFVRTGLKDGMFHDGLEGMDIDGLSLVNAGSFTPLDDYLSRFDVVLVASAGDFADPTLLGDRLADYVDAGGGVGLFAGSLAFGSDAGLGGKIIDPDYSPLGPAAMARAISTSAAFESHDITDGIAILATNRVMQQTALQGAGMSLGTYDTGYLLGAYRDDKPIAVINVFPSDLMWSGDLIQMTENLIYWCFDSATPSSSASGSAGGGGGGGGCFISGLAF